jgi:hypothetical protein
VSKTRREGTPTKEIIKWLLEGEPRVEYRTRVDLLEQSEKEAEAIRARKRLIEIDRSRRPHRYFLRGAIARI